MAHLRKLCCLIVATSQVLAVSAIASSWLVRGKALFVGHEALKARIRDQRALLPSETVRCRNCHVVAGQSVPERAIAPRLDRPLLLEPRSRRGGPPSAYELESFCTLLRRGVDPAHILIARAMPVYELDDEQCQSLWTYVIER
jgi:hypothetical protein